MTASKRFELIDIARRIATELAAGEYGSVEHLTNGVRLSAAEMAAVVDALDCRLVPPPAEFDATVDIVAVTTSNPPRWSVWAPLWSADEGRSDLSIMITVTESVDGYDVELDDLHVP